MLVGSVPTDTGGDMVAVTLGEMLSFLGKFTDEKSWFDGLRRVVAAYSAMSTLMDLLWLWPWVWGPCGLV